MSNKIDKSLIINKIKSHYGFNSDTDFAKFLGIKPQTLSSWHSRNTFDIELIYAKCVNINGDFLLSGNGEVEHSKSKQNATIKEGGIMGGNNGGIPNAKITPPKEKYNVVSEPRDSHQKNNNLIPLYDGLVAASSNVNMDMSPQIEPVEYVDAGDWFRDATAAMRVHGDSMYPDYDSGSIIAMKEVINKRLVVYGQDYVLETTEYRVLKRLQKSDDKEYWLLASANPETWVNGPLKGRLIHEPFDVHIDDVMRLFKVLGCVKRNESSRIVYNNASTI